MFAEVMTYIYMTKSNHHVYDRLLNDVYMYTFLKYISHAYDIRSAGRTPIPFNPCVCSDSQN